MRFCESPFGASIANDFDNFDICVTFVIESYTNQSQVRLTSKAILTPFSEMAPVLKIV